MSKDFDETLKNAQEALKQLGKPRRKKILVREGPRSYTAYEDEVVVRATRNERSPTRLMDMLADIAAKVIGRYATKEKTCEGGSDVCSTTSSATGATTPAEGISAMSGSSYTGNPMIKHRAEKEYRFKDNPLEKVFADKWEQINTRPNNRCHLEDLMGDGAKPGQITQRDALVAARVVQWLGTHVGECFLADILSRPEAKDLRKRIEHELKTIRPTPK